jgi:thioredoxin 1
MAKYIELNIGNFDENIKNGLVVVDFWATWCGPCRQIAPIVAELSEDFYGKATIAKVDVDFKGNQDLSAKYEIRSIPAILFFKNGKLVERHIGSMSKDEFTKKINKHI